MGSADRAEREWAAGEATWYVSIEEIKAMSAEQRDRYAELQFSRDPVTGLWISRIGLDLKGRISQSAYLEVIKRKLRQAGREPPSFE